MDDIKIFLNKNDSFYCDRLDDNDNHFIGFGNNVQNSFMIIFSFLGIFINLYFFFISIKRIIKNKKSQKVNISSIEKILCVISIIETCISICWLINSFFMGETQKAEQHCNACRAIGTIELFLYLFDWMILSSTLFQIKKVLTDPLETLKTEKNIYRYIIFCAIFGIFNVIFGFYADVEGVSPILTCFIDVVGWSYEDINESIIRTIFYIMFFLIPICVLLLGIYKVYEIRKLPQFINNKNNRRFFRSYLQYILTYIVLALLLISVYVIDYFIGQNAPNGIMKIYFIIVTNLSCGTPLIVGIIRLIKTKLIKKIFFCINKNRKNNNIDYCKDELLSEGQRDTMYTNDNQIVNFEQELICKEFKKIFIGISYTLDKSNQLDIEEENEKDEEKNEEELNLLNTNDKDNNKNNDIDIDNQYIINKQEILKNFDLNINEDLFVLDQEEINIEATEYCPNYFKNNRKKDNIKEVELVKYFRPKDVRPDLFKKTSDSNYYINSTNKQFILKSINSEQIDFYIKTIKKGKINEYLENNVNSLINRVYGLYHLKIDNIKDYYIALMENIYECIEKEFSQIINKNNNNDNRDNSINIEDYSKQNIEKKMYIYGNEIQGKILKMNKDVNNLEISVIEKSFRRTLIRKESIFKGDKKFNICLHENEYNRLKGLIQKDTEFLSRIGINRIQFFVVRKSVNYHIWNNLFNKLNIIDENKNNDDDNKNDNENDNENKDNNKVIGIKRYIFKSVENNIIYCISITGYFNNYDD